MTLQTFKKWQIGLTFILSMIVSISIVMQNSMIALTAMIIGSLLLIQLRRSVKGVIADERDYDIAGKSALLAMRIFGWIGSIVMVILFSFRGRSPFIEPVAYTLSYSICLLILMYTVISKYYGQPIRTNKRFWFSMGLSILVVAMFIVAGVRLFSGEDDWICKDGKWIQHGHPSFPAPTVECK